MRTLDETIEMINNLSDEDYALTKNAADLYYSTSNTDLLNKAVEKTGMTAAEILWIW